MPNKTFLKVLITVIAVCFLATAIHAAYVYRAYDTSSIIYFISKELW